MEIQEFETHGRKLLVEFRCYRCKTTVTRPLKECISEIEYYSNLYDLRPPKGWKHGGFYYPMFCPECKEAYDLFMNNEEC
jgi:hypothetical protein